MESKMFLTELDKILVVINCGEGVKIVFQLVPQEHCEHTSSSAADENFKFTVAEV